MRSFRETHIHQIDREAISDLFVFVLVEVIEHDGAAVPPTTNNEKVGWFCEHSGHEHQCVPRPGPELQKLP